MPGFILQLIGRLIGLESSSESIDLPSHCECCGNGEFTQWEKKQAEFERQPDLAERAGGATDLIEFTHVWQERRCTMCGKIQQEELDF